MENRESAVLFTLKDRLHALHQSRASSHSSSRQSSEQKIQLGSLKRFKLNGGLLGMPQDHKRPSMILQKMRMLETREMPRRDSIHHSLHFKRRFSGRHLTPLVRTSQRPRIKRSPAKKKQQQNENVVRFVDPKSLPDRVSPKRYGNFLVRVFDGNLSQTKEQLTSRLLNTSRTTRSNQFRRSVMLSDYSGSDGSSSTTDIRPIKQKRTGKKKQRLKIKTPSLFKRTFDNITVPSTPNCLTPTSGRSVTSSQSFALSNAIPNQMPPPKSARSQFSSPFKLNSPRQQICLKPSPDQEITQLLTKGKLALLQKERGGSDEPISRFLEERVRKVEEVREEQRGFLTPLIKLSELQQPASAQPSPRSRIDGIHRLMILGRNCQVEMSQVLQKALREKEQENVEKEMQKVLFGLQKMQTRQVRGYVRKFKLQQREVPKGEN